MGYAPDPAPRPRSDGSAPPERILVALSGGVDSAVAALRLREQGHEVAGAYIRSWMNEPGEALFADCPWEEDIRHAQAVARHLNIDFEVIDFIQQYRERVVAYLVEGYRHGRTPNPDLMCNREMKFGLLREWALREGFGRIATGHYARRREREDGLVEVLTGIDPNKDQSYFLALVQQHQLRDALFPIGDIPKHEVRDLARKAKLPNAERKDSQGICFLGKVNINDFLRQYITDTPGPIVRQRDGVELGTHRGLHHFTLGQRKGLGIPSNTDHKNYVVVGKDLPHNRLLVAFDEPDAPGLYQKKVTLRHLSYCTEPPISSNNVLVRPRYRDPATPARLDILSPHTVTLVFEEPQRALASGQLAALYNGEILLGGGIYV